MPPGSIWTRSSTTPRSSATRGKSSGGSTPSGSEASEPLASIADVAAALSDLELIASGKVREIYDLGDELLLVASDRISTYDAVHPTPIPDKGAVLTGLSAFWFDHIAEIVPG